VPGIRSAFLGNCSGLKPATVQGKSKQGSTAESDEATRQEEDGRGTLF